MNEKTFDLADWRSRLDQAEAGDDLLALAGEIHARIECQAHLSEPPPPTQGKVAAHDADNEWAALYKTPRMRDMAAQALALSSRKR